MRIVQTKVELSVKKVKFGEGEIKFKEEEVTFEEEEMLNRKESVVERECANEFGEIERNKLHELEESSVPQKAENSFYRRKLPDTCISLDSEEGKKIFKSSLLSGGAENFFRVVSNYHTQSEPAWCALGTLVVALNALTVDPLRPWKGVWRLTSFFYL